MAGEDAYQRFAAAYEAGRAQILFRRVVADLETPIGTYLKLAEGRQNTFLLESVQDGAIKGRYSMIGLLPDVILKNDATHGVQFVDFDQDGRVDLALTNNDPDGGGHPLLRNTSAMRGRSIAVEVTDPNARRSRAGSEVRAYRAGRVPDPVYNDQEVPVSLRQEFSRLLEHSPFLLLRMPHVADYLQAYPHVAAPAGAESFFYWSKDVLAARPILSVTHVTMAVGYLA